MVVALNSTFKQPVAHFSTTEICAQGTNIILNNLCCDNAASDMYSCYEDPGAALLDCDLLKMTIDKTSAVDEPIFVVLDTSNLIKLAQNIFEDLQLLFTEDGRRIESKFICELEKLSAEELPLVNKITQEHVQFSKKMRVYLATLVVLASVADAIEFCEKILN
jgi:hypothetical protein